MPLQWPISHYLREVFAEEDERLVGAGHRAGSARLQETPAKGLSPPEKCWHPSGEGGPGTGASSNTLASGYPDEVKSETPNQL